MNIRNGIDNLSQLFPSQKAAVGAAPQNVGSSRDNNLTSDKANLSAAASQLAQSGTESDVRLDKVASIQNALAAGTYQVPASEVAKKVVSALLTPES
jgi:negative regulator of flagellin synthesis FlgM